MLFGKTKKRIEDKETEIKLNLSNNYKDSAFKSYMELLQILEELKGEGKLGDKDYMKQISALEKYKMIFRDRLEK